jgi:hypothetical protein
MATTLLWNLFVRFFTFFTFLTQWRQLFQEFFCPLLCVLYFPDTTAKITFLLPSLKNITIIIMLIEHTFWPNYFIFCIGYLVFCTTLCVHDHYSGLYICLRVITNTIILLPVKETRNLCMNHQRNLTRKLVDE